MNLPNKLSILRICFIPFVMFFYLQEFWTWGKLVAAGLFLLAVLTDMLDGYIARKYNLVTDLGKLLDTNADKILVLAGLLLIVCDSTIPAPYGVIIATIIIGRDMVISAFRQIAASKNFIMSADKLGKIKAVITDIAVIMFMLLSYFLNINISLNFVNIYAICCYVIIGIATLLTIISMLNYIIKNRGVIKENK